MIEKPYRFDSDWTTPHYKIWESSLAQFKGRPNLQLLEIGVRDGRSALWFLEFILTGNEAQYTGIDLKESDNLRHNFGATEFKDQINFIKDLSFNVLKNLHGPKFDIIYIDGCHKGKGALEDIVLSWRLLKYNGVLILDDYGMTASSTPTFNTPKFAIDSFLYLYRDELVLINKGYQVIVEKRYAPLDELSYRLNPELLLYWNIYDETEPSALWDYDKTDPTKYTIIESTQEERQAIFELLRAINPLTNIVDSTIEETNQMYKTVIEKFNLFACLGISL